MLLRRRCVEEEEEGGGAADANTAGSHVLRCMMPAGGGGASSRNNMLIVRDFNRKEVFGKYRRVRQQYCHRMWSSSAASSCRTIPAGAGGTPGATTTRTTRAAAAPVPSPEDLRVAPPELLPDDVDVLHHNLSPGPLRPLLRGPRPFAPWRGGSFISRRLTKPRLGSCTSPRK